MNIFLLISKLKINIIIILLFVFGFDVIISIEDDYHQLLFAKSKILI